jgi:hypothetical protein
MTILYSLAIAAIFWSIFYRVPVGSASGIFIGVLGLLGLAAMHEPLTRDYLFNGVGLLILGTLLLAFADLLKHLAPKDETSSSRSTKGRDKQQEGLA